MNMSAKDLTGSITKMKEPRFAGIKGRGGTAEKLSDDLHVNPSEA
jgi:hypothetical protein